MKSLIIKCQLVTISIVFDGITIYPHFIISQLSSDENKKLESEIHEDTESAFDTAMENISELPEYDYIVYPRDFRGNYNVLTKDGNHKFYHQDGIDQKADHLHYKFKRMINMDSLGKCLTILVEQKLLSPTERETILEKYADYFLQAKCHFIKLFAIDFSPQRIINYVKTVTENEILAHLHQYLLESHFKALREVKTITNFWQGTNQNGSVVSTSQSWAMIEKAISLQMAKNIKENTFFDEKVASSRAKELANNFPFFAIKRRTSSKTHSKAYTAFAKNDKSFDSIYEKHFAN